MVNERALREAFSLIKKDIRNLREKYEENKGELNGIKEDLDKIKEESNEIKEELRESNKNFKKNDFESKLNEHEERLKKEISLIKKRIAIIEKEDDAEPFYTQEDDKKPPKKTKGIEELEFPEVVKEKKKGWFSRMVDFLAEEDE